MKQIMGWESSDVFIFDVGSLLKGQTGIAKLVLVIRLLLVLEVCNIKPNQ